jgi:drug/metabolite transporter (DMT)-like permease
MMICALSGGILVPMVYDALYLGYKFSALQVAAVVLIISAFVVMNLDGVRAKKNLKYLMWCALLFVVNGLYGVLMNLQQTLMEFTQRNEMIITTFLGMGLMTAAFELLIHRKRFLNGFRMEKKAVVPMVLSSVSATLAVNLLMWVTKSVNVTVMSVVNNGGVLVLSAVYAFTVFKEKAEKHTVIGILMACASIVLLSI